MRRPPGEVLDEIAAAVFDGPQGRERLAPLLVRWDDEVGRILDDDAHRETLLAIRIDWALCEAAIEGGGGPGDTWLRRAVAGDVDGVIAPERWAGALGTHTGVFEVWPTKRPFLRDRVRGVSLTLSDPIHVEPPPVAGGPAALWEVRLFIDDDDGARMCREPLPYPIQLVGWLEELQVERFGARGAVPSIMRLRRRWLQYSRARHTDPMAIFSL